MKRCPRCTRSLPLTLEFWRKRSPPQSHLWRPYCRVCDRPPKKGPRPSLIVDGMKACKMCKEIFPATFEFFDKHKQGSIYLRSYCRACNTKRHALWVQSNRAKVRAAAKKSYRKHRQERIARELTRDRKLRADPVLGPARRAAYAAMAQKRRENPEYVKRIRAWDRQYAKTDAGRARYDRRRARKADAPGQFTRSEFREIARRQDYLCFWCGTNIAERSVADHYIPLSRGGTNYPSNIVASCASCNSKKHNKLPQEFKPEVATKSHP